MERKYDSENVKRFLELVADNPDLPILPMVDGEICADDEHARWCGSFGRSYIGEYFVDGERVHFRDDNNLSEVSAVVEDVLDNEAWGVLGAKEYLAIYKGLSWIKAIIVNIDLPN